MHGIITWEPNSSDRANADNFAKIDLWWSSLNGKTVSLAQRIIPVNGDISTIDWSQQRFDETFTMEGARMGGITLYWSKPEGDRENNITPRKLELSTTEQYLDIYSQAQQQLLIRVAIPGIDYQTIAMEDPQISASSAGENRILYLRDPQQSLEFKITLSPSAIAKLREYM
ncbi:MAG: hypothetical protein AB4290_03110 [Spirulina sp.]